MDARNHLIRATTRVAVAMKLTSCTSLLEILFQEDCMVAIPIMTRVKKTGNINRASPSSQWHIVMGIIDQRLLLILVLVCL